MQPNTDELFNIEAEQSILGCILIDNSIAEETMTTLTAKDFFKEPHKIIFNDMFEIFSSGSPIDFVTMIDAIEKKGHIESVGGIEYISHLTNYVPSTSNFRYYIDIVKEYRRLRDLKRASQSVLPLIENGKSASEIINKLEDDFDVIKSNGENGNVEKISGAVNDEMTRIQDAINGKFDSFGISTGFPVLDKILWGMRKSQMLVLGARAGVGKTAFALNIIDNVAVKQQGKNVLFFSIEMPKTEIIRRLYSIESQVDNYSIKSGKEIDKAKFGRIKMAQEKLDKGNLWIDDTSSITVPLMQTKAMQLKRKQGLDLVVIDYLSLIQPTMRTGNKWLDIGEIARNLKLMARKLDVPVIVLAQLNRALDTAERRPTLADLSDSSEIEKNADVVLFLYDSESLKNMNEPVKNIDRIIAKNRNGEKKIVRMEYKGATFTFAEKDKSAKPKEPMAQQEQLVPIEDIDVSDIF